MILQIFKNYISRIKNIIYEKCDDDNDKSESDSDSLIWSSYDEVTDIKSEKYLINSELSIEDQWVEFKKVFSKEYNPRVYKLIKMNKYNNGFIPSSLIKHIPKDFRKYSSYKVDNSGDLSALMYHHPDYRMYNYTIKIPLQGVLEDSGPLVIITMDIIMGYTLFNIIESNFLKYFSVSFLDKDYAHLHINKIMNTTKEEIILINVTSI